MKRNVELGEFLRSRRVRLKPEDIGLIAHGRRRAAGLRREEVAGRSGISTEWYIKLEQGRVISPSSETLAALAQALKLSVVEEAHLRALARDGRDGLFVRETVPSVLRTVVEGLAEPAYLTGERWDILAWNSAAAQLFIDFGALPEEDRNILVFMLVNPLARELFEEGWAGEAQRMVSLFRANYDLWAPAPAFLAIVERLHAGCPEFATWWREHHIAAPMSGEKRLMHRQRGPLEFHYSTFKANDESRLKLSIYVEKSMSVGTAASSALD
ncbi:helix-turn-helix domain-containing protein [Burkholderia gladioli]|uniref:MmyB family transcriptional regulator n=1 Tax=Burkholderia gladioli TaxID=28095 RepID=UPI00164145D6|nr:helix-turn-helix domain-containing protein [Burkholderia gladioli]